MAKYKTIEIKEKFLEDLVRQFPDNIEKGLIYVDHQRITTRGPLDVLLVDSGNSLVVCELKIVEDDNMLSQGLDYYDYMTINIEGFARAYSSNDIKIDPKQEPRLFLIAPSFSIALQNRCKWINIPVSLFTFQCIALESAPDDLIPIFQEIIIPSKPEIIEVYSVEQRLKYFTDDRVRKYAEKFIGLFKSWEKDKAIVEATKYDISLKLSGRVVAYIAPRRKYFLIYTFDLEGTLKGYKIDSELELDDIGQLVKINFDRLRK